MKYNKIYTGKTCKMKANAGNTGADQIAFAISKENSRELNGRNISRNI